MSPSGVISEQSVMPRIRGSNKLIGINSASGRTWRVTHASGEVEDLRFAYPDAMSSSLTFLQSCGGGDIRGASYLLL